MRPNGVDPVRVVHDMQWTRSFVMGCNDGTVGDAHPTGLDSHSAMVDLGLTGNDGHAVWRLGILMLPLLLLGCGSSPSTNTSSPSLSSGKNLFCANAVWDLGEVDPTDPANPIQHTFTLENRSGREIVVKQVRANCGCLTPSLDKKTLAAGESISLPVGLTLAPVPGPFSRGVFVDVAEPEVETIELQVKGKVGLNAGLFSMPSQLDFGTVREGETVLRQIVVGRHDGSEIAFQSVSIDAGELTLAEAPTPADGPNTVQLPLKLVNTITGSTSERRELFVTVHTDRPAPFDVLKVRARATFVPRFSFVPSIYLTGLADGERRPVPLLSSPSIEPCPIREVRYEGDDRILVQLDHTDNAKVDPVVALTLHAKVGTEDRTLMSGTIVLSLEGSDQAVRIPVIAAVKSRSSK